MTSGWLCFQSPGWYTQLPVIFTLRGFVLGHFLPSDFRLPHWLQSEILKICSALKMPSLLRMVSAREICQVEVGVERVWVGRRTGNKDMVWGGGGGLRRVCRICAQGDDIGFFWNKELEAWEWLGLVSCGSSWHLGPFSLGPVCLPPGGNVLKWDGFKFRSGFCCLSPVPWARQPLVTCFFNYKDL